MTDPKGTPLVPACINCGYSQQGLIAADACPECGARRTLPHGSETWVLTTRAGLTIFAWTIPLSLVAWAAPGIAQTAGQNSTTPLISDRSWFLIVAMSAAIVGIRRLMGCLAPLPAGRWSFRLAAVTLVAQAMHTSRVLETGADLIPGSPRAMWTVHEIMEWMLSALFAVWLIPTARLLSTFLEIIGLPRCALRLRRWGIAISICLLIVNGWNSWGYSAMDAVYHFSTSGEEALIVFKNYVYQTAFICDQLDTLIVTLAAALAWYFVLQGRHQLDMLAVRPAGKP